MSKTTEEKVLQAVNLAPSEDIVERLTEIHPMRQIFWASIIQVSVFGFMLFAFWAINLGLKT
jgi:hypothetical protein|tara:strand:- start:532 stop:717 length:186 start_codon:yes stop_codon:yes gene_type:complete